MKNVLYLMIFMCFGCGEHKKSVDFTEAMNTELKDSSKKENIQTERETNFDCYIKYLDAVFLQKPTDCEKPKPIQITIDSITSFAQKETELMEVVFHLDSLTGRKTKFKFNLGTFGAIITNYSDSLYALERKAWIKTYKK